MRVLSAFPFPLHHRTWPPFLPAGHKFSASNPYGAKQQGDTRQFVRV